MSEATIQASIQDKLQAMADFADADVVIADWSILDGPISGAPYARIMPAENFELRQDNATVTVDWEIPVVLYVAFTDWADSYAALLTLRQNVLDAFTGDNSALGVVADEYAMMERIATGSPIIEHYLAYNKDTNQPEGLPVFLFQALAFGVHEETC